MERSSSPTITPDVGGMTQTQDWTLLEIISPEITACQDSKRLGCPSGAVAQTETVASGTD